MFASPVQLGRLPWSYDQIWRVYQKAAESGGRQALVLTTYGTRTGSWLDSVGTQ